jgi:hypothetical protein
MARCEVRYGGFDMGCFLLAAGEEKGNWLVTRMLGSKILEFAQERMGEYHASHQTSKPSM